MTTHGIIIYYLCTRNYYYTRFPFQYEKNIVQGIKFAQLLLYVGCVKESNYYGTEITHDKTLKCNTFTHRRKGRQEFWNSHLVLTIILTLSDPGGGSFLPYPWVNWLLMFFGWVFQFQNLMVFQVDGTYIVYWTQKVSLLVNFSDICIFLNFCYNNGLLKANILQKLLLSSCFDLGRRVLYPLLWFNRWGYEY